MLNISEMVKIECNLSNGAIQQQHSESANSAAKAKI